MTIASRRREHSRALAIALLGAALVCSALSACGDRERIEVDQPSATPADSSPAEIPTIMRDRSLSPSVVISGPLMITQDNYVLNNSTVNGCIVVAADNVEIRNSVISCHDSGDYASVVEMSLDYRGLTIEGSLIDGNGSVENGVGWGNYSMADTEVRGTSDGLRLGGDYTTVTGSFIHDIRQIGDLHSDAMQTTSGAEIVVTGNFVDATNQETGATNNAALMIGSEQSPNYVGSLVLSGNYLDGGGYAVNMRNDTNFGSVSIDNNIFGSQSTWGQLLVPAGVNAVGNTMRTSQLAPVRHDA